MGSRLTITRPNESRPVEGNSALIDTLRAAVLPVSARLDCIIYVTNITPGAKVFRTAVEARGAVALNGIAYLGRNLKIGRINEFQLLGANYSNESTPLAGIGGEKLTSRSVAPKESCRLYVGNIPPGHRDVIRDYVAIGVK
ncbi:uncharacterized protein [Anabrus simplex]|uniref:uncharacterized protein n=1 Tax=Anabrus simplex TaxID=316456 RepID=UPI0035A3657C